MPTPLPAPYTFMDLEERDRREVTALDTLIFPDSHSLDDLLTTPDSLEWERMWGIHDGVELAATHGTYSLQRYPVPGAHTQCGWLTWVGVHPGHRRRGLLRAMIAHHFQECRDRQEPVSGLFAAEPAIYGRFGYGMAARHTELALPRGAQLRPVPRSQEIRIRITNFSSEDHGALISDLHRRSGDVGLGRPGWATWETPGLKASQTTVTPALAAGKEPLRILLAIDGEETVGYATFRRALAWQPTGPDGTVQVQDFAAVSPAATHRMWSVLLDLDLMTEVTTPMLALDDPLLELLVDIRKASARVQDNSWLRIVDLPRALEARKLAGALDVVVEVSDSLLPENSGHWRIAGKQWEHPEVIATERPSDVSLDIRELSAAYLGGASLLQSLSAGLGTVHDERAAADLALALAWPVSPVVNWIF